MSRAAQAHTENLLKGSSQGQLNLRNTIMEEDEPLEADKNGSVNSEDKVNINKINNLQQEKQNIDCNFEGDSFKPSSAFSGKVSDNHDLSNEKKLEDSVCSFAG